MVTQTASNWVWEARQATSQEHVEDERLWELRDQVVSDVLADRWLRKITAEVYKHREVEELYVAIGKEPVVDYWIVIPHRDITLVRRLIEDQRRSIIALFAGTSNPPFQLDLHICYRECRSARKLIPSESIFIPRI